jgi:serine/threonine protein kinase
MRSGFATGTDPGRPGPEKGFALPSIEDLRRLFPQLEIVELIGRGGMGAVYKARQPSLDRFVALKILPASAAESPGFAERFTREARALARLTHARIVAVHDFGEAGGLHYLVMEFVDGLNLRQVQQSGRLSPQQALRIVPQVCDALQFAHDRGIVHRDIKPENILLGRDGQIKITDFGIAKMVGMTPDTTAALTGVSDVVGTPHYMAPEQIEKPTDVDHRADIYSLGVVFYEMLTGELPIGRFAPPSKRVEIDVRLDEVVLRTLEKEPDRRYQQAAQVKTQVETIVASSAASAAGGSPGDSLPAGAASGISSAAGNFDRPLGSLPSQQPVSLAPALVLYGLQAGLLLYLELAIYRIRWPFWVGLDHPFGTMFPQMAWPNPMAWLSIHFLALLAAYIAWAFLHHSCWKALPERYRATSPARAVGFMFIPFFNFYWAFVTFPKLAEGFNTPGFEHPEVPMNDARGLGILKAISFVAFWTVAWLPYFASAVALADAIVFALYYRKVVLNANRVTERQRNRTAAVPA